MVTCAAAATSARLMSCAACSSMKAMARRRVAVEASLRSRAAGSVSQVLGKTTRMVAARKLKKYQRAGDKRYYLKRSELDDQFSFRNN